MLDTVFKPHQHTPGFATEAFAVTAPYGVAAFSFQFRIGQAIP